MGKREIRITIILTAIPLHEHTWIKIRKNHNMLITHNSFTTRSHILALSKMKNAAPSEWFSGTLYFSTRKSRLRDCVCLVSVLDRADLPILIIFNFPPRAIILCTKQYNGQDNNHGCYN